MPLCLIARSTILLKSQNGLCRRVDFRGRGPPALPPLSPSIIVVINYYTLRLPSPQQEDILATMPRYPGRTLLYVILAVGTFLGLRGVLYRPESESGSRVSLGGRTYTQRPATFSPRLTQEEERTITCPPVAQVFDLTRKSTDGAQCVPLKVNPYHQTYCRGEKFKKMSKHYPFFLHAINTKA